MPAICCLLLCISACSGSGRHINVGNELIDNNEWDESVEYLREAAKENPQSTELRLLLFKAEWNASIQYMEEGEKLLASGNTDDAITALARSIELNPDNQQTKTLIQRAEKIKRSDQLYESAARLMKEGDYKKARDYLLQCLALTPGHEGAEKLLSYFKPEEEGEGMGGRELKYHLNLNSHAPISLRFKKTPIVNVFEVLSKLSGINFIFDKDMRDSQVTLFMTDVSFDRFIDVLLRTNKLAARVINGNTMLIYPSTPDKIKEYEDLQIRTFYLSNIEAPKMVSLLSKILRQNDISANDKLNAVVIRGTSDMIQLAANLIEANDRPPAEVLLNVEILEVKREKQKQLGLEFSDYVSLGIGGRSTSISSDTGKASYASLYSLDSLSNKELLLSLPTATLNLLRRDGDTRVLAKPQIRVANLEKAFIHVGDRVPIRSNRKVDTNNDVTYDYVYQDVGIKLETIPVINMDNVISLSLSLEVSGLGTDVGTENDPQYSIRTRNAKTVLTMKDGEVIVIGGLISDEERENIKRIPFIGSIPLLGGLFSSFGFNHEKTDILMVITPYVIKNQEIPDEKITQMWSGKEREFSLREPYESRVKREGEYQDYPSDRYFDEVAPQVEEQPVHTEPEPDVGALPLIDESKEETDAPTPLHASTQGDVEEKENAVPAQDIPPENREETAPSKEDKPWKDSCPYSIHVNSYTQRKHAEKRMEELTRLNYESFFVMAQIAGKGLYYRVFVGQFENMAAADDVCRQLKEKDEFAKDIHVMNKANAFNG